MRTELNTRLADLKAKDAATLMTEGDRAGASAKVPAALEALANHLRDGCTMPKRTKVTAEPASPAASARTRVIYCGDNLEQLKKLPGGSVDLIYIDPPFNSNRNYEVFWGETKEKRAFEDRHESTKAYIEFMRPRSVELARVLKKSGSFYYHCDWHASHYVKVMLDQGLCWKR